MTIINTRLGAVEGADQDGYVSFLGLPFAAPPVGALRWQPPQRPGSWSGVYDATQHPNRCFQPPYPGTLGSPDFPGELSEDCLYLNIHTPAADAKRRPVLVYIHGGGYVAGSANDLDASTLCAKHDVLFVAMNYRLGLFGFMDLSRIGPEYATSASLGFQDQIAALRWIRENIQDYGGDPENITINGVSAGAGSVLAMMSAPDAKGLFQKAVAFSPAELALEVPDMAGGYAEALSMSEQAFFEHASGLSGAELLELQNDTGLGMGAAVDGHTIAAPIDQALREGINRVPLLIGNCEKEGTMLVASVDEDANLDQEAMLEGIAHTISAGNVDAYKIYLGRRTAEVNSGEHMAQIWTDYFRAPVLRTAQTAADVGLNAWVYSFEVPTDRPFGCTHSADMPFSYFLFERALEEDFEFPFHPNTEENRALAEIWSASFASFLRTGDPNCDDLPEWQPYSRESRVTMVVRETARTVENYDGKDAIEAYGL